MTPVINALLNPHITRLNGSMGSGTDFGRTTFSTIGELVKLAVCPRANSARLNIKTAGIEMRRLRMKLVLLMQIYFSTLRTKLRPERASQFRALQNSLQP